jgi:uncharacterized protein (DUF488 family)
MIDDRRTIWTVGHSTRSLAQFLDVLASAAITLVADVRRFPASRRFPHFNQQPLKDALAAVNTGYVALPDLGGRRRPHPNSGNTAWRNLSFRGYADYMETDSFQHGIDQIRAAARNDRVALLCSEAVWWRCHRALIADYLKVKGDTVIHILSPTKHEAHPYTSAAHIIDGHLTYTNPSTHNA